MPCFILLDITYGKLGWYRELYLRPFVTEVFCLYEIINLKSKRKPTGKQLDHLIDMIENGVDAKPTVDEVYESFRLAFEADKKIRGDV